MSIRFVYLNDLTKDVIGSTLLRSLKVTIALERNELVIDSDNAVQDVERNGSWRLEVGDLGKDNVSHSEGVTFSEHNGISFAFNKRSHTHPGRSEAHIFTFLQ